MPTKEELFRLDRDPGEEDNLSEVEPEVVSALRQRAQQWLKRKRPVSVQLRNRPAPEELVERLKSLGYIR